MTTLSSRVDRARRLLGDAVASHAPVAFASSFGAEDMVVLDLIARDQRAIGIFTIDTGRLPDETHALIEQSRSRYGLEIAVFTPWATTVDAFIAEHGVDGFYEGVAERKSCCRIRKVEPLRRALAGKGAWVTGLRRDQAESRVEVAEVSVDNVHGLFKFNPLAAWSAEEVWDYVRDRQVPFNALHDRGYPSIGCEPCTRAVRPGEHPRAGRWWWEQDGARKECGLHEIPIKVMESAR